MFVVFFLFAICTIQCILSTLAWVPMQTSFKVLKILKYEKSFPHSSSPV